MRRGEIWLVDLDPTEGSEAGSQRPAVIVSNDGANVTARRLGRGVLTVVPVTSNTERVLSFQTLLPAEHTGLQLDSKAQAEQVRAIDVRRLTSHLGGVPEWLMDQVDAALRLHLQL